MEAPVGIQAQRAGQDGGSDEHEN